jgi:two-component sensor histidine kinase
VLEVDSRDPGEFSERDVTFLQGAANLLGMAIERRHYEERLKNALEHQQALLREVNHRVKNSLQLVASLLRLQMASVDDEAVRRLLTDAKARVMAISRAHERLYKTTDFTHLDVSVFLREVCADLGDGWLRVEGPEGIRIETDRAIPLALVVTELVTNCIKYAYPEGDRGPVWVRVAAISGDLLEVSVADEGVGLPDGFDPEATPSFGMRLIRAFAQRLDATLEFRNRNPGAEVVLRLPLAGQSSGESQP